jgi:hypothetical protein
MIKYAHRGISVSTRNIDKKGPQIEAVTTNSAYLDHHCSRHRNYRFHKNRFESRSVPITLFLYLAGHIPYPYRDHNLVMAADHKEITQSYEHDGRQEPNIKFRGYPRLTS